MTVRKLTIAAVIAALYAALTLALPMLSYGPLQIRFSEALTVLPFILPEAIPGLFVGCLLANLGGVALGATTMVDVVVGPIATLIAALLTYRCRKKYISESSKAFGNVYISEPDKSFGYVYTNLKLGNVWLAPLPPVLVNALIIGMMLSVLYSPDMIWASFPVMAGWVALGQALACYGCGIPLLVLLNKTRAKLVNRP